MRALCGILVAALALLQSAHASAQCTKDTDCKGERVCEAGTCVAALPPAPPPPPGSIVDAPGTVVDTPVALGAATTPAPATPETPAGTPAPTAAPPAPAAAVAPTLAPSPAESPPPDDFPKTRRHSPGMMVAGIFMVSAGPLVALLAASNSNCDAGSCRSAEVAIIVSGLLVTAIGVPLIVMGARRVPDKEAKTLAFSPWGGPHGGGANLWVDL